MAQATDSPIGFLPPATVSVPEIPAGDDRCLEELHAWQASPAGLIEAGLFSLGSTVSDLTRFAESPVGFRVLAIELTALELVQAEIGHLIGRLHRPRGLTA
jgi:hypothetical protein